MEPLQPHQSRWYRRTDPQGRALLALLLPLAGVYLCQLVTLQEPAAAWAWMGSHAGAAGYTYLVLLLAQLLVTTLTDSLLCGQLLTLLPCLLLSVASHLKQAVQVAGFLRPGMELGEGTWGGIALAALLFLAAFVWSRPARPLDGRRRLGVLGLLAALLAWVMLSPASAVLLAGEEGESQSMRNDRLGLLAGLYSAARESAMAEPDSYSEDGMNRILLQLRAEAEQSAEPAVKPNVVLVVSESFFDPTRLPGVSFSADPVPNFHTLAEAFPSGVFLSNTYAGGTGNVEMELFTGIPSAFLGAGESLTGLGDTSAYRRVPSLARVFGAAGYETLFVHSYNDELYDRARNIPALGFDQIIYQDDFLVDKTYAGGYVSDDTLADELIARFEAKGDGPVFLYGLTMENHQPYFGGKFNTPAPVASSSDNLSGEEAGVLDALVHGLTDADAALPGGSSAGTVTRRGRYALYPPGLCVLGGYRKLERGGAQADAQHRLPGVEQLWGGTGGAGGGELYRPGDVSAEVGGAAQAPVFPVGVHRYGGDDPLPGAAFRSRRRHPLPHASRELRTPGGGVAQHRL